MAKKKKTAKKSTGKSNKKAARKSGKTAKRSVGKAGSKAKAGAKSKSRPKSKAKAAKPAKKPMKRATRKAAPVKSAPSTTATTPSSVLREGAEVSELMMWAGVQDTNKPERNPGLGDDDDAAVGGVDKLEDAEDFGDVDDDEL